jgi:uncharacterized membrane protein YphA (DoxX/SURF4 family)
MATTTANYAGTTQSVTSVRSTTVDRVSSVLRLTYGLVPIVAGADKFTHYLVNWDQYLAPQIANILPFAPATFMMIVGVIEIVAGLLVLIKPRVGSMIVGLWLLGIAFNLVLSGQYYDIAVRDIVMAIGAFSLFALAGRVREYRV